MIIVMPDDNSIVKWKKNDKEDWKYAEISDLIKAYEERPHGEWINSQVGQTCNRCKEIQFGYDSFRNFCPNCGAEMRKKV